MAQSGLSEMSAYSSAFGAKPATPQQFEDALAAVQKGPLPPAALDRLAALQQAFAVSDGK
jgi:hypothetical protein